MIKVDENDPVGELDASFPFRDVQIKKGEDVKKYYDLEGELGRGKFGTVFKCKEKGSKLTLAAKFIPIERRQDRKNVEREVEIMRTLQHPRLIQLYDAFEADNIMCVILELIEGGELFERVIDDDFILTEKACTVFMRQICEGVEFIHRKNILHLDLKPENILCLTKTGNRIKIIDFGLARKYEPDKKLQVLFGTPEFVAPEVVNFDQISFATDMWSVGVICYVLLSGLSPFMGETDVQTMSNVTLALYDFDDEAFDDISADAKDFIAKLLVKNKEYRLTANQCLNHPWLKRKKPRWPMPCLDPTKENLRTYVENFTPHNGINLIKVTEGTEMIQDLIEPDKRNYNQNFLRSLRKGSLTNERIPNNDIIHSRSYSRPLELIPLKENWPENMNTNNSLVNNTCSEKPVRYKMTLTPLVKNVVPNNLILPNVSTNELIPYTLPRMTHTKVIEDVKEMGVKEYENKTTNESLPALQKPPVVHHNPKQGTLAQTNLVRVMNLCEPKSLILPSLPAVCSNQQTSNVIPIKSSIIIPTTFSENSVTNTVSPLSETCNMELPKSDSSQEENINNVKWPSIVIKMSQLVESNERAGSDSINNSLSTVPSIIDDSSSNSINSCEINPQHTHRNNVKETISIVKNENSFVKVTGANSLGQMTSLLENKNEKKFDEANTPIFNAIKRFGTACESIEYAKVTSITPIIKLNDSKWKMGHENVEKPVNLLKTPFVMNHRKSLDSQNLLMDESNNKDIFFKSKLKSIPPWFSELQEKPKVINNPIRRPKFKMSIENRDVPLGTPLNYDIERFIGRDRSASCIEINVGQKLSKTLYSMYEATIKEENLQYNQSKENPTDN